MADAGLLPVSEALQQIWDGSTLGASYKLNFYQTGTSTRLDTFPTLADAQAGTNANANPVVADADGRVAVYGAGGTAYKIVVTDASDAEIKTIANVNFIPGSTVAMSKTPSEYQIAFYEDVSGSYKLTNSQTEDTYDFKYASTGITLGTTKKFFWRDANISIHSAADGYLDLTADTAIRLNHATADTDVPLHFVGTSNTGIITWMEDEDYFNYSDDILMSGTERIYLRDTDIYIYSQADGVMEFGADSGFRFNCGTDTDITFNFIGTTNSGIFTWDEDLNRFRVDCAGFEIAESASVETSLAGYGVFWVKSDTPATPRYTDDAGADYYIGVSDGTTGGSGSAGSTNQYVELNIGGTTYKVLHDGTV